MGKHRITRKQMKKDEFVSTVTKMTMYVEEHWKFFAIGAAVIAGIALISYLLVFYSNYRSQKASDLLNVGIEYFHAPVAPGPDAKIAPSVRTFATNDEKFEEALKKFEVLLDSYSNTKAGRLALYYSGLCQMNLGRYDEASKRLEDFIGAKGDPFIMDIARSALARCYDQKKEFEASAQMWKQLAESKQTLFPRDEALLKLAESLESQGKSTDAMEIYKRITQEYPGTRSAIEASTKLQG